MTFLKKIFKCKCKAIVTSIGHGHSVMVLDTYNSLSRVICMLIGQNTNPRILETYIYVILSVYSSWEVGKLQCFTWIKERFSGQNIQFCVIGDGWEECEAAQSMKWPFVQVDPRPGSSHRFPGLNVSTLGHYLAVIYDQTKKETDETASQNSSNNLQAVRLFDLQYELMIRCGLSC